MGGVAVHSEAGGAPSARAAMPQRARLQVWFLTVFGCILIWTCLVQLLVPGRLWPHAWGWNTARLFLGIAEAGSRSAHPPLVPPPPLPPLRNYTSNGYLKVSCNGGLNQMRAAICDMVTVARLLNLTLVIPELDKQSFWADPSNFDDLFDVKHFIDSLKDEVHITKRLPKKISGKASSNLLRMRPVSWSDEKYYLQQILPLFNKSNVIHFNKTDARLANNLPIHLQKLRCHVNYHALKFTPQLEALGNRLVQILQKQGSFIALHLRYEMDMLAFSGCTHGCSKEEADELKSLRYAYPWWREKEIDSVAKRLQGFCPLTPEETTLVLEALGFDKDTQIYIASGEIYGGEKRLSTLRAAFPKLVRKEMLLDPEDLRQFQNHSSQMAALDYMVSLASDVFIPTYDGNMAKVVEGQRRYLGFRKTISLDRRKLVELLDLHNNKTLSWDDFASSVRQVLEKSIGQPTCRRVVAGVIILWCPVHLGWKQRHQRCPKTWPVIGSTIEQLKNYDRMHDWLAGYLSESKTVTVSLPFKSYTYIADPASVEHVLKTNFANYPKGEAYRSYMDVLLGDGIFNADGELWRAQRKTASLEFASKNLRDFSTRVFREHALKLSRILCQVPVDRDVDMQDLFMRMTLDSIGKVGFGVEIGTLAADLPENAFAQAFDDANIIVTNRFIDPFWRIKRLLRVQGEARLQRSIKVLDEFTYDIIRRRKAKIKLARAKRNGDEMKHDLLSRFIELGEGEGEGDGSIFSDDKSLRDVVLNFVIAGRDTTAATLSWFIYMVMTHPGVAEKLHDELKAFEEERAKEEGVALLVEAFDDRMTQFAGFLSYDSMGRLAYLHACISETLRLYPAVPQDPKGILKDDVLPDGTKVKAGDMVTYVPYVMGRMEYNWGPDAALYKPERWFKDGILQTVSPFKFTAFQVHPPWKSKAHFSLYFTATTVKLRSVKFELELYLMINGG
ncbi:hypothetical protein C4D60_Mb08t18510 [Musa balbisiana]|uniref:O-fucosyltransferase family protein n=1 Tax=Musa balbisiana TaxID=52838 RepID=A0A4S8K4P7_MUSBA|nr:hypothetical protein C4D60_Mb08t18510 [Musa balbisiana]